LEPSQNGWYPEQVVIASKPVPGKAGTHLHQLCYDIDPIAIGIIPTTQT
jgi:hypothetical protein